MNFNASAIAANEIKNETTPGANSATRVGNAFLSLIGDAKTNISPQEWVYVDATNGDDLTADGTMFAPYETLGAAVTAAGSIYSSLNIVPTIVVMSSGVHTATISNNNERRFRIVNFYPRRGSVEFTSALTDAVIIYSDHSIKISYTHNAANGSTGPNGVEENSAGGDGGAGANGGTLVLINCTANGVNLNGGNGGVGGDANGVGMGGNGGAGGNGGSLYLYCSGAESIAAYGGTGGTSGSGTSPGTPGADGTFGNIYGFGFYQSADNSITKEAGIIQVANPFTSW